MDKIGNWESSQWNDNWNDSSEPPKSTPAEPKPSENQWNDNWNDEESSKSTPAESKPIENQVQELKISGENGAASAGGGDEVVTAADFSLMRKILRSKLVQSKNQVEVMRADPRSPLHSIKTFEELRLPAELLQGLYEMGFQAPSKIQETALPLLLATPPSNMIAQSQSGTGKTAAFLLSSLYRVEPSEHYPQVLILSPTYELAIQTGNVAQQMAKFRKDIQFKFAVRGEDLQRHEKVYEQVVIGTPGKLLDWALRYRFFDIKKIKVFVLDEADVMIDTQGHRQQSIKLQRALPHDCQMMLFSATYDQEVMEFAEMIVRDPVIIKLKREEESLDNINQYYVECLTEKDKYLALANVFGTISMGQAFIFCQTKRSAASLAEKLRKDGHSVGLISGDLTVDQRSAALQSFREGQERVLIATNVVARGIDVEQVTVVINYDLPVDVRRQVDKETYLHRIGRTGRFGKEGLAINLIDSAEGLRMIRELEQHFGRQISKLDATDIDEIEKINQE